MKIESWPIQRVKPYDNNPRVNDGAVDAVATSIREFGLPPIYEKSPLRLDPSLLDRPSIRWRSSSSDDESEKKEKKEKPCCFVVTATFGEESPELARVTRRCQRAFRSRPILGAGWKVYQFYGPILADYARSSRVVHLVSKVLLAYPIVLATNRSSVVAGTARLYLGLLSIVGWIGLRPLRWVRQRG